MAVSTIPTYKLLNAWQRVMNENQWRYNQVQGTGVARDYPATAFVQPERDEVARALNNAVQRVVDYLEYYPRPVWVTEEVIPLGWGHPYQLQTLETRYKHLIEFGSRATTLIDDNATVLYTDSDGDGVNDLATITVTTTVDVSEVAVFFRTADGAPDSADELYEIEPLKVVRTNATTVTITGHRSLFVRPGLIWDIPYVYDSGNLEQKNYADIQNAGHFVTMVDVYRVYTDTTNAVQLRSDGYLYDCAASTTTTLTSAGARILNKRLGVFQVRASACGCTRPYESVIVNYKAGLPLVRGQMEHTMEEALIRFANTFFGQEPCPLYTRVKEKWDNDRNAEDVNLVTPGDVRNPFGLQRGAIFAWRTVNNPHYMIGKGGKLTARA